MIVDDANRARLRVVVPGVLGLSALVLVGMQVVASSMGLEGPIRSLLSDYVATPRSMTVPWAGLLLALVGLPGRRRLLALAAAVGIDAVFTTARLLQGQPFKIGNGALIVLTAIVVVAAIRWSGKERATAIHAAALGALLILATKVGDTWLQVTARTQTHVLDDYAELADRALGSPAWLVGQLLQASGPVPQAVIHWVYIELPLAAIVVAIWQLRNVTTGVWPRHYLVRTFLVLGLIGPLVYMLFPVVGPVFAFADNWPHFVPNHLNAEPLPFDDYTPRNCMPSMHTAWALAVFLHSRQGPAWLRAGGTFWLVCTVLATLGLGYHYGVDLVAGAVLCLTVEAALRDPARGWDAPRWRLVGGGAVVFVGLLLCYRYLPEQSAQYPIVFAPLVIGALVAVAASYYRTFVQNADTPGLRVSQ